MKAIFDLEQRRVDGMPAFAAHQPGLSYFLYRRHSDTLAEQPGTIRRSSSSGFLTMNEHSGTHVDALCHQAEDLRFYGCHDVHAEETAKGFRSGDAASLPIFHHRGVLFDVAPEFDRAEVPERALITADHLAACAERQNIQLAAGSVALIRTGNGAHWADNDRYLNGPGVAPSASQWLADRHVFAVGADNIAWDLPGYVDPDVNCDLPGHVVLLVRAGIYIFENLYLEELAQQRVYSFQFVAAPPKFVGATGSPVRPFALEMTS